MIILVESLDGRRETVEANVVEEFAKRVRELFPRWQTVPDGMLTGVWGSLVNKGEGTSVDLSFKVMNGH